MKLHQLDRVPHVTDHDYPQTPETIANARAAQEAELRDVRRQMHDFHAGACVDCGRPRSAHYDRSGIILMGCPASRLKVLRNDEMPPEFQPVKEEEMSRTAVVESRSIPADEPLSSALPALVEQPAVSLFERLAKDPAVDVEKLERLMQLHERALARTAAEQFNAAMNAAQGDMRPIAADADNPQTRSRYASYRALDHALRPIYTKHGFGLSFDTGDCTIPDHVRVLCYVTHAAGHARTYKIDMPADGKGARGGDVMTKTHAAGSAVSYGMRYLLKMIFNVAVGEDDDDGNRASATRRPVEDVTEPAGYDNWLIDLGAAADEGWPKLSAAFGASKLEYRKHLTGPDKAKWSAMRQKAEKVQR